MKTNSPKLSKYDRLWLKELYETIINNKRPSYRSLRAKLYKSLPADYDPNVIDEAFARYKGEEIMIEGVDLIDPKMDVFNKANKVIDGIKNLLLANPEKEEVTLAEIEEATKLNEQDISLILRLISPYGKFWNSASGNQKFQYGYSSLRIQSDHNIFDQYLYFTNIRDVIKKHYSESSKEKSIFRTVYLSGEDLSAEKEVRLNPIFKSKIDRIDKKLCFVLMPFKEDWSDSIFKLIRTTIESLGYQCLRADNLNGPIIIEDIWTKINQAGFIIADVTNRNPNVMYEVGIAHTVGRPTILLTQNTKEIPFDFTHLRHIEYKNTISYADEFKKKLTDAIDEVYKRDDSPPISRKPLLTKSRIGIKR